MSQISLDIETCVYYLYYLSVNFQMIEFIIIISLEDNKWF